MRHLGDRDHRGKPFRQSLKTRNFERAEILKRKLEDGVTPREKGITIKDATDVFIKDCQARNLNTSTFGKYKRLCKRILSFGGPAPLDEWTVEVVRRFRSGWTLAPRTAGKQLEHLRQVFKFCVENGWLSTNPAKAIKVPQVKVNPRIPFTEEEVSQILSQAKDDRELAFLMVLRYTGLRIGDASLLKVSQFTGDRIYLYTTKAGTPVSVVIPDSLCSLLKRIAPKGGYFFVRADSTSMHTCSDLWRRRIKIICKGLGISPAPIPAYARSGFAPERRRRRGCRRGAREHALHRPEALFSMDRRPPEQAGRYGQSNLAKPKLKLVK